MWQLGLCEGYGSKVRDREECDGIAIKPFAWGNCEVVWDVDLICKWLIECLATRSQKSADGGGG